MNSVKKETLPGNSPNQNNRTNSFIIDNDGKMFSIFDYSPIPVLIYDQDTLKFIHANQTAIDTYGYNLEEFLDLGVGKILPQNDVKSFMETNEEIRNSSGPLKVGVHSHITKDGSILQMELTAQKIPVNNSPCVLVSGTDVTEKEQINALDRLERDIMERSMDMDYVLTDLLYDFTKGLEDIFPGMRASILKVDGHKVYNYASPSLPKVFVKAINGEEIGPTVGSCGTAAFLKKRVVVTDIDNDPLWVDYRTLAIPNNLRACWSEPIFNANKEVVATFANYYEEVKEPTNTELKLFSRSASLLGIILENRRKSMDLMASNELYNYVNKATNDATYDWDIATDQIRWGHSFARLFGYTQESQPANLNERLRLIHGLDRKRIRCTIKDLLTNSKENRLNVQYRFKNSNGTYRFVEDKAFVIRDSKGKGMRMIGVINDVTQQETESILIKLRATIYQILGENYTMTKSLKKIAKLLATTGNYSTTEIWLVDMDNTKLNFVAHYGNDQPGKTFYKECASIKNMNYAEGLPGIVWKTKKNIFWKSVAEKKEFKRGEAAIKSQVVDMIGLPLIQNNDIIGVLVLGTSKLKNNFKELPDIIGDFTTLLATEIKRKQVEIELQQLVDTAPDIICQLDFTGTFKRMNVAGCKLLGYSEEELLQIKPNALLHADDFNKAQECLIKLKNENRILTTQNRYVTKSGNSLWLSWTYNPSKEEGLIYGVAKNITEEKSLANLLDMATEMARIGSWEIDLESNKVYWSKITKEIHEVEENYEPNLEKGINFYRNDARPVIKNHIENSIKNGTPWDLELPIITAKGNEVWVRAIGKAEFNNGKCTRIHGSFQDIDSRKTIELRLKAISNNLPGVIFKYNLFPDGSDKLSFVSDGSFEVWGLSPEECMASTAKIWERIEAAGDLELLKQSILDSAEYLTPWQCTWRHRTDDGLIRWNEGKGKPTKMADGTVVWDSLIIDITDRKVLEQGLERATNLARIGSWEIDTDLDNTLICSPMTRELLEVDDQYVLTFQNVLSFYHGSDSSEFEMVLRDLVKYGKKFDLEVEIKTGKGNIKWIRVIGEAEYLHGKTHKVFGSIQDIHILKESELQLKSTLKEKSEILERIGDGFFAVDNDWQVKYWNRAAEQLTEVRKDDIIGKNLWDIFSDALDTSIHAQYMRAKETGTAVHFEDYFQPLDKWFEISAHPSITGLSVYFKDVSDRKLADLEIKKGYERFEKVTQATSDAIWDWDMVENTLYWGKGFTTLFGYNTEKGSPTLESWSSHLHPDDRERVIASLEEMLVSKDNNHWREEYRYLKGDGNYSEVIDKGILIRDENGKPNRMVGAMSDITAQKLYEKSLKEINQKLEQHAKKLAISNEELEQFAYMASHDLQEPLRMVTSFLTQLERKYNDKLDEKAHQYIYFAVDGAKRMRNIILDLLEYSRVGKDIQNLERIDLNEVVSGVLFAQQQVINENQIEVKVAELPIIQGFNAPLVQVFHNLISNAIKFRKKDVPAKIEIGYKEFNGHWEFTVQDNGIGIDKNYFPKIFLIFQRLHSREDYSGTGIGLSIVKKIVENFGGQIWVESIENKGSKFYFTIPKEIIIV
ncbi:PAS domain-containing protein [Arenibacter sp. S6351L]|uniref:PAS domain-containing protein n=1 Tax=Arenibacter sp. S6351L TaxID=2926407 RepID=UPI001FF6A383|nr:PAS domain-containing protein [Arenibacter sp. S6351L]MCK0135538.1 PAS domain-containing protein [Arenibacter sp. S6351L]